MDHIIGISNKTCFSENKKPNNLGEQFLHLTIFLCWQFWQKHYGCGGGWELIFYIQVEFIFYCIFKPKRADWYFQKGLKNMYKKKNCLFKSNLLCKNFLDCLRNEDWGGGFQNCLKKCSIIVYHFDPRI